MSTPATDLDLQPWTAEERESFFVAIERHRRASWQVTAVTYLCIAILALILALLTAPLFYAVIGVLLDVVNLIVPMPDVIGRVTETLNAVIDAPQTVSVTRWMYLCVVAALPGACAMVLVLRLLGRIVQEAEAGGMTSVATRAVDATLLVEQRFANVVAEMAIAANVAAPKVLVVQSAAANAGAFGATETTATILVSTGLLQQLERAQMQAVAGHLIGLIANGDIPQGMRIARSLSLFGFVARLSDGIVDPDAWRRLWALIKEALRKDASPADAQLILELTNPFGGTQKQTSNSSGGRDKLTWREWARMPLFGPLVLSGFFGGMVSTVVLEPLIALAFRRRKYMADAISLQLTRDPAGLADALTKLAQLDTAGTLPAWMAHMSVMQTPRRGGGLLSGSAVPMFPSLERRLKALGRMGAGVTLRKRQVPLWAWGVGVPIAMLVAGLLSIAIYLLVMVSIALSGLFTWFPAVLLHMLLR